VRKVCGRFSAEKHYSTLVWVLPPVVLAAFAYHSILQSYFFADDFLNLYWIENRTLFEYLVTPHGGHLLLTRNLVFYVSRTLFGLQPEYYLGTVLFTHLLNVCLLFAVIRRMIGSSPLASFGAAVWGISPLHEGTLGWYSVYGHALATTALLVILYQALGFSSADRHPSWRRQLLWLTLAVGAATCFGTGLATSLALPWVLLLIIPHWPGRKWWKPPLWGLAVLLLLLYAVSIWRYVAPPDDSLLPRAVWSAILTPIVNLQAFVRILAYGSTQLCTGLWFSVVDQPALYYGAFGLFVAVVAWACVASPGTTRRWLAFCSLLIATCYGSIAVARGGFSQLQGLDMATMASRYHYTGQLLLTLMLCLILGVIGARLRRPARIVLLTPLYASVAISCGLFPPVIDHHDRSREDTKTALAGIERAIRAKPVGEAVFIQNGRFRPLFYYPTVFPGLAAAFVIFYPENTVNGRPVLFVDSRPGVMQAARTGVRTADLFVGEAPPENGKISIR
jgi:hypothetical protein